MIGCRKIYCNLLLLSVIIFSLGGAVRPVVPGWEPTPCPCAWCEKSDRDDFQWEAAGTSLVYRHVHLCGAWSGTVSDLLAPDGQTELHASGRISAFYEISRPFPAFRASGVRSPRAPPVA